MGLRYILRLFMNEDGCYHAEQGVAKRAARQVLLENRVDAWPAMKVPTRSKEYRPGGSAPGARTTRKGTSPGHYIIDAVLDMGIGVQTLESEDGDAGFAYGTRAAATEKPSEEARYAEKVATRGTDKAINGRLVEAD